MAGTQILLIVGADIDMVQLRAHLARAGSLVNVVATHTLASALVQIAAKPPGITLVDLGLPDGSGMSLIRKVRKAVGPTAELIAYTNAGPQGIQGCLDAGADTYAPKAAGALSIVAALWAANKRVGARRTKQERWQQLGKGMAVLEKAADRLLTDQHVLR